MLCGRSAIWICMYPIQKSINSITIYFKRAQLQLLTNERSSKKWFHNPNSQEPERRSVKTRGYRPCRRQSGWLGQDDVTQSSWAGCQASPSMRREKSRYWKVSGMGAMPCRKPSLILFFWLRASRTTLKITKPFRLTTKLPSLFGGERSGEWKVVSTWHWSRQESHDGCLGNHHKDWRCNDGEKNFSFCCLCVLWRLKRPGGGTDFPNPDDGGIVISPFIICPTKSYGLPHLSGFISGWWYCKIYSCSSSEVSMVDQWLSSHYIFWLSFWWIPATQRSSILKPIASVKGEQGEEITKSDKSVIPLAWILNQPSANQYSSLTTLVLIPEMPSYDTLRSSIHHPRCRLKCQTS